MKKLALLVVAVAFTACGGRDAGTADTAAGTVAPPPATTLDTIPHRDTTMRDTTRKTP